MNNIIARRVAAGELTAWCTRLFCRVGVSPADAQTTAEIMVAADLRGISSHGVGHLRRYISGLQAGVMLPCPQEQVIAQTPTTVAIDAGGGLGPPAGHRAMVRAIQKAREFGSGFATVRNSNHFGIAGYYAMLALEHDCIGFATTNASPMAVPTFARNAMLGTNPIAVAVPAGRERPFVLDMATSTVALGKLEIAERLGLPIPLGWAVDETGTPTDDPGNAIAKFRARTGGGLLPLGGAGEMFAGYKGYGLALWMDIMAGVLAGAAFSSHTYHRTPDGRLRPANVGHFFGAWRIDAFRPLEEFRSAMEDLVQMLKAAPKAEGQERIYIAGEKEFEATERNLATGVPLDAKLVEDLRSMAAELSEPFPALEGIA